VAEVCLELTDQLDLRVQQVTVDPKDLQVPRASKVMKVPLVSLVCKANEVSQEDKARLENKARPDQGESLELTAKMEILVLRVCKVCLVQSVPLETRA